MILASAFFASLGGSLIARGVMTDRPVLALIGGAILLVQAVVLWLLWVTS